MDRFDYTSLTCKQISEEPHQTAFIWQLWIHIQVKLIALLLSDINCVPSQRGSEDEASRGALATDSHSCLVHTKKAQAWTCQTVLVTRSPPFRSQQRQELTHWGPGTLCSDPPAHTYCSRGVLGDSLPSRLLQVTQAWANITELS